MSNYDVEKTIVVPDSGNGGCGGNFLAGMLASACQQRGLDANAVMALCNGAIIVTGSAIPGTVLSR